MVLWSGGELGADVILRYQTEVKMLEKLPGKLPGSGPFAPIVEEMEEFSKDQSVIPRMHMEVYTPLLAMLAKQTAKPGEAAPAIDPGAPLPEMTREVAELSSDPVDAGLFEIAKGYTAAPVSDLLSAPAPKAVARVGPASWPVQDNG
jgi:hypothetical protein